MERQQGENSNNILRQVKDLQTENSTLKSQTSVFEEDQQTTKRLLEEQVTFSRSISIEKDKLVEDFFIRKKSSEDKLSKLQAEVDELKTNVKVLTARQVDSKRTIRLKEELVKSLQARNIENPIWTRAGL